MARSATRFVRHLVQATVAGLLLVGGPPAAMAQAMPRQTYVEAPDGVKVAIQEWGHADGPEILFIHGLLGSHLDWLGQVQSPALQKYRLVTYDLRGHGLSDKPSQAPFYVEGKRWGEELDAVIRAAHLKRPILVGWSLGAVVITNYLNTFGDSRIAGVVYVDGVIEIRPDLLIAHSAASTAIASADLQQHLRGVRAFLEQCFLRRPAQDLFELLLANAALASPDMNRVIGQVSVPAAAALPRVTRPVLLIYGAQDALVRQGAMVARARTLMPRAEALVYEGVGHAPFVESPERFNGDLGRFVQTLRE